MRVLAVLFGLILLLPGLCSFGFMVVLLPGSANANALAPFWLLWIVCFAISFGGFMMIRAGMRGPRPPQPRPPQTPRD